MHNESLRMKIKAARLVNWYSFFNEYIPFGDMTMFAARNMGGKSVLMDAIKYALFGDTRFNMASETGGDDRNIVTTVRGLMPDSNDEYYRCDSF